MILRDNYSQTILETNRLYLKELNPEIVSYLFTSCSDDEIASYMALKVQELAVERYKFENGLTTHQTSFKNFLLLDKTSGSLIGKCGFHTWYPKHSKAEIGYGIIDENDKGKGYMKEAMKPIIRYGFEEMKLNRIEAYISPANTASLKLTRGLGFTEEGTLREHYYKHPKLEDSICFSILKSDYDKIKDQW